MDELEDLKNRQADAAAEAGRLESDAERAHEALLDAAIRDWSNLVHDQARATAIAQASHTSGIDTDELKGRLSQVADRVGDSVRDLTGTDRSRLLEITGRVAASSPFVDRILSEYVETMLKAGYAATHGGTTTRWTYYQGETPGRVAFDIAIPERERYNAIVGQRKAAASTASDLADEIRRVEAQRKWDGQGA
jgi:hypothetical protein